MTPKDTFPLLSLFWSCKWNYFLFSTPPSPVLSGACGNVLSGWGVCTGVFNLLGFHRAAGQGDFLSPESHLCLGHAQCFWSLFSLPAFGGQIQQFCIFNLDFTAFPSHNQVLILQDLFHARLGRITPSVTWRKWCQCGSPQLTLLWF